MKRLDELGVDNMFVVGNNMKEYNGDIPQLCIEAYDRIQQNMAQYAEEKNVHKNLIPRYIHV